MTLIRTDAAQLLDDLSARRLGAAELMQATLERIDKVNPSVNAIVAMRDADDLIAEAKAFDDGPVRGPLHGLPFAIKDTVNVAGFRSTFGTPLLADYVPARDDLAAARIRAAGAILIGKTNVPEFGLGSHTFNPVYGATRNPYDTGRSAGGSSGGAAVSLATGMTALADGSDVMGSLRNPATWNNVYGFRPTLGRVPNDAEGDTFMNQLLALGPMARSPEDIALLLDILSVPNPLVPFNLPYERMAPLSPADPKGLRVGWLGDWGGAYPMEPGILDNCQAALTVLDGLGCNIEPVAPPFSAAAIWDSWVTLRAWATAARLGRHMDQPDQLKESAIWEIEQGRALSAQDVHAASVIRSDWFRCAAELFQSYDALVLPSVQVWPFDVDKPYPTEIAGQPMDTYHRWMEVVIPVSLIGLPALAMPSGFGPQGLPNGVQIFGPRGGDAALLALGAAYHRETRWPQTRPAL